MKLSAEQTAEHKNQTQYDLTAEFTGGSVGYTVIEGSTEKNPVLIVPGFTEGRFVLKNFAETINELGGREVIYPDQPKLDKISGGPIVDQHAEALLAVIKKEGFDELPLDIIAHSFGTMVVARAAELAKDRGITSFEEQSGSHSVFIAPAGTNDKENLVFLGGRWVNFLKNGRLYGKELDPTGDMMKAGVENFKKNLSKTIKETLSLSKKSNMYGRFGTIGLKPFVMGYAGDDMYPHKVIESVIDEHGDSLEGYSVPIDTGVVGARSFDEFKEKTKLEGPEATTAWAHHYRNAGHNDLLFHPERTAKAILQVINQ